MTGQVVGRLEALWRYPVKSMLGESLQESWVSSGGLCGDRARALWDQGGGRVASAKNPRLWQGLLGCRASYVAPPQPAVPLPPVAIEGAGGETVLSSDPAIHATLSGWFGRQVSLLDQPPEGASLDQYWPPVEQRAFQDEVRPMALPAGAFFDSTPIHAISTASLERLRQLEPQLDFAVERFRPNLLIAPTGGAAGFVEEGWIGRRLRLGEAVELMVEQGCPRCVITTLAQGPLPQELEILRATARHNRVVAGILLSVRQPGAVAVGDAVTLLD